MKWTQEAPQEPGWYWLRINGDEVDIVRINKRTVHGKTYLTISAVGECSTIPIEWLITKFKYEWAGPISEPEELNEKEDPGANV